MDEFLNQSIICPQLRMMIFYDMFPLMCKLPAFCWSGASYSWVAPLFLVEATDPLTWWFCIWQRFIASSSSYPHPPQNPGHWKLVLKIWKLHLLPLVRQSHRLHLLYLKWDSAFNSTRYSHWNFTTILEMSEILSVPLYLFLRSELCSPHNLGIMT